eukprot:22056-Hanusia_phi.AAC.2
MNLEDHELSTWPSHDPPRPLPLTAQVHHHRAVNQCFNPAAVTRDISRYIASRTVGWPRRAAPSGPGSRPGLPYSTVRYKFRSGLAPGLNFGTEHVSGSTPPFAATGTRLSHPDRYGTVRSRSR